MIEVNLLPPELRPLDRTPLPRLLTILIGVAIVGVEVVMVLILFMNTIPDEQWNKKQNVRRLDELKQPYDALNVLKGEIDTIVEQETGILALLKERRRWTPTLDRLTSLVPEQVWLTRLRYTPPRAGAPGEGDYLELDCMAHGSLNQPNKGRLQRDIQKRMADFKNNITRDTPLDDPYGLGHIFTEVRTVGTVNFQKLPKTPRTKVADTPTYVGKFTLRLRFRPKPDEAQ